MFDVTPSSGRVSVARRRHIGSKLLHVDSFVSFIDYFTKLYQLRRLLSVYVGGTEQADVAVQF